MTKFFDYLSMDLPLPRIRELGAYIIRFVRALGEEIPVEGRLGAVSFCATALPDEQVRVHWVQVGRERITMDATI